MSSNLLGTRPHFSKGPTQAGALESSPHADIAYKGGRAHLGASTERSYQAVMLAVDDSTDTRHLRAVGEFCRGRNQLQGLAARPPHFGPRPRTPFLGARMAEFDLTHERWTPYLAISSPRTAAGLRS